MLKLIVPILLHLCASGLTQTEVSNATACYELQMSGKNDTILQTIHPFGSMGRAVDILCDFMTDGGGWTIIQKRSPGGRKDDFFKNWASYEEGFGNVTLGMNFWLGLGTIRSLTELGPMELLINLTDWKDESVVAQYKEFSIGNSSDFYRLMVDGYSGNASDSLTPHNGQKFSTFDSDNDQAPINCAQIRKGAWWYNACYYSNLNGYYYDGEKMVGHAEDGVAWNNWKGSLYSLKRTEMKIRPPRRWR